MASDRSGAWRHAAEALGKIGNKAAGERDTVFIQGREDVVVTGDADATEIIQVQAP